MAHIKLKDLTVNSAVEANLFMSSDSFIRDLSECELALQGGRLRPVLPPPIVGGGPAPFDPLAKNDI
jgi:hypothetical protein